MVAEDLEYLLQYGTPEQRSQAIVKVARTKSIEAIPALTRVVQDDSDPEMRELAAKAVKYLIREYQLMDEDKIDYDTIMSVNRAITQYRKTNHHAHHDAADWSESRVSSKPQSPLATLLFGILFMIMGMGTLTALAMAEINSQNFAARAASTMGVVVDLRVIDNSDGDTYMPVIEFAAQNGEQYRIEASFSSSPPRFSIGDTVEVLYPPESPYEGVLAVDNSVFTNPMFLIIGIVAIVFGVIGMGGLIAWVRMGSKKQSARPQAPRANRPAESQTLGGDSLPREL